MHIVISPAKSLDFDNRNHEFPTQKPLFQKEINQLVSKMRRMSKKKLGELMDISDNLATLNRDRYQDFSEEYNVSNSKAALLAFTGDVYQGMNALDFSKEDIAYANKYLHILSGLYGVLSPTDRIQPYRLEMGTKLKVGRRDNLVKFWKDKITPRLNEIFAAEEDPILINLASNEYFNAIDTKKLNAKLLDVSFKEMHNGTLKIISFNAKKARGLMARFIIKNKIQDIEHLKGFDLEDYTFNQELSTEDHFLFTR